MTSTMSTAGSTAALSTAATGTTGLSTASGTTASGFGDDTQKSPKSKVFICIAITFTIIIIICGIMLLSGDENHTSNPTTLNDDDGGNTPAYTPGKSSEKTTSRGLPPGVKRSVPTKPINWCAYTTASKTSLADGKDYDFVCHYVVNVEAALTDDAKVKEFYQFKKTLGDDSKFLLAVHITESDASAKATVDAAGPVIRNSLDGCVYYVHNVKLEHVDKKVDLTEDYGKFAIPLVTRNLITAFILDAFSGYINVVRFSDLFYDNYGPVIIRSTNIYDNKEKFKCGDADSADKTSTGKMFTEEIFAQRFLDKTKLHQQYILLREFDNADKALTKQERTLAITYGSCEKIYEGLEIPDCEIIDRAEKNDAGYERNVVWQLRYLYFFDPLYQDLTESCAPGYHVREDNHI